MRIINTKIDIKHSENSKKDGKKPEIAKKIVPLQLNLILEKVYDLTFVIIEKVCNFLVFIIEKVYLCS